MPSANLDKNTTLNDFLKSMPLIAILRGLKPQESSGVAGILIESGFRIIEVPLNSPNPLESIRIMSEKWDSKAIFGAGTVLNPESVEQVKKAGGRIIVSPNFNPEVVAVTKKNGLFSVPGVATPTEAFSAIDAGADALKIFPGEMVQPKTIKAMKAVLPKKIPILVVGGITEKNMAKYWKVGVSGFGIGSSLYRPGRKIDDILERAKGLVGSVIKIRG